MNKNRFLFHVICTIGFVGCLILSGCAEGPDRDIEHKIFLTHAELNLIEGDEVQITASPTNQAFTWESSNAAVVTVSSTGLVRAVADGACFIYVTSSEGLKRTIPVDVIGLIPLTGIEVVNTADAISMIRSQSLSLRAIAVPEYYNERVPFNVIWESKDENIVQVDKTTGTLVACGSGNTEVTVSCVDKPDVKKVIQVEVSVIPSVMDLSQFAGTGLDDNLVYKRVYLENAAYGATIDVQGLTAAEIAAAFNRDFMEWDPATETLTFTGQTGEWDVYYSDKYKYFWIRQDEPDGSTSGVYWLRGSGFTQVPVWHSDLAGSSGGYCWGLAKIRFAAYMKPLGNNRFQASIYIASEAESSGFWITVKHNLCAWTDPPGTPLTLVAPEGFAASNTDINKRPDGFTGGYYRLTIDLNAKQRILEKID